MNSKFLSRRWALACLFSAVGCVALFTKHIDGGTFVALVTIIMGIYTSAGTYEKVKSKEES